MTLAALLTIITAATLAGVVVGLLEVIRAALRHEEPYMWPPLVAAWCAGCITMSVLSIRG